MWFAKYSNTIVPDQRAPLGARWSGAIVFANIAPYKVIWFWHLKGKALLKADIFNLTHILSNYKAIRPEFFILVDLQTPLMNFPENKKKTECYF